MPISAAVDPSALARVLGIETKFSDLRAGRVVFLPQRIAVIGQGATAATFVTTKRQVTSALEVAQLYGFGSPLHLAVKQLMPVNGDGVGTIPVTVYPLEDDGSGVAAVGDITPSGSVTAAASYRVRIGGILSGAFNVAIDDTVADIVTAIAAAVTAELDVPVVATDDTTEVGITSKWKGASANDIFMEIVGDADSGITFGITQLVGGDVNPGITTALDQFGEVWETMVLNCMEVADTDTLDALSLFGEARWGALTRKPLVAFVGSVGQTATVPDARTTDRVNSQLVAPGSPDLPLMVAARQLARIAVVANSNPPHDYGSQDATGVNPGTDGEQWDYVTRDARFKQGSSTVEVKGGVVNISDVVTFYHPAGDPTPAYRYVVDVVKLQNIIFNLDLIFASPDWDGAPLIPDNQPTVNRSAKQPKGAVAAVSALLDDLGLNAIISDPETAKANTFAEIDGSNPKRLNVSTVVQLSGNTNIISVTLNFGFFFGG
jgi:phage tail sheath gpL-like